LAFTCERNDGDALFLLRPSRRYAHSTDYLDTLLMQAGFGVAAFDHTTIRRDRDEDIAGVMVLATAPVRNRDRSDEAECETA
jgi:predicted TPR repeat methyltransferase